MLEVRNLQRHRIRTTSQILEGPHPQGRAGEVARHHGAERRGQVDALLCPRRQPGYEVTGGEVLLDGEDLLRLAPDERAAKGVFLSFQYPMEIPGVATMTFLEPRSTPSARRAARRN